VCRLAHHPIADDAVTAQGSRPGLLRCPVGLDVVVQLRYNRVQMSRAAARCIAPRSSNWSLSRVIMPGMLLRNRAASAWRVLGER
jgi:hypothetical protein